MSRLETRIGGLALPNPVICSSGEPVMTAAGIRAALRAGAAGVIAKSVNEQPAAARQLDRADYAVLDAAGNPIAWGPEGASVFCRSGLKQSDPAQWFATVAALDREAQQTGRFVATSIVLGSADGAVALAQMAKAAGARIFELNVGAPHASEAAAGAISIETDPEKLRALVARVREATEGMMLWVKLTGLATNLPAQARAAQAAGADAVGMMGRFMALVPDLEALEPALGTSAGYGGRWALPITCRFLALSRKLVGKDFPLIGTNGVRDGLDVARMALAGASAVEMLSLVMQQGFGAITRTLDELDGYLAGRGLAYTDLVGRVADRLGGYAERPEKPGRWKDFVPPETLEDPA